MSPDHSVFAGSRVVERERLVIGGKLVDKP
jgi:hypothetical protein